MSVPHLRAEDFEECLWDLDLCALQCLRENLIRYLPKADADQDNVNYVVKRIRDMLVLEEINKMFIINQWPIPNETEET
jgi:hypothetical protein